MNGIKNLNSAVTVSENGDLRIERIFDAPRERVWRAWSDPQWLMKWWGPIPFTAPVCHLDFRVGGKYLFCMRSPEGQDYWSGGEYLEIIPLERIVYTDKFTDAEGNTVSPSYYNLSDDIPSLFEVSVSFEALPGNRTRMTLLHTGLPVGDINQHIEHSELAAQGWSTSFDKMAQALAFKTELTVEPGRHDMRIRREFNAPLERVFNAFTDPKLIPQWWGPSRYTTEVDHMEPRTGGGYRFLNVGADGDVHAFRGVYHEIAVNQRIVQTFEYEGAPGHVSLETATFEALDGGHTRVRIISVFQTVEDRNAMLGTDMESGMNESYDRLEQLL